MITDTQFTQNKCGKEGKGSKEQMEQTEDDKMTN